jgi:hypothetical protein
MANCTGLIYGLVTNPDDGSPISGVQVSINWVQEAQGGALQIGGDDSLSQWVPTATTTSAGEYAVPFFWASERVPGNLASALAMRFYSDNSYTSMNRHGQLDVGLDLRRLLGVVFPPIPDGAGSAGSMVLKFWTAATPELKGMGILTRFIGSLKLSAVELQGCYSRIDFPLPYVVGSFQATD